mgnify:CR=1 FL=1
MMSSRGMGAISPNKMPKPKRKQRRDDTSFYEYAEGGEVWNQPRPERLGPSKKLSPAMKSRAKSMASAAGRPYPNLVDNMRAARGR